MSIPNPFFFFSIPGPLLNPIDHACVRRTALMRPSHSRNRCLRNPLRMIIRGAFSKRELVYDQWPRRELHVSEMRMLGYNVHEIPQLDPEDCLQCEEFGSGLVVQSNGGGVVHVHTRGPRRLSQVIAALTPERSALD